MSKREESARSAQAWVYGNDHSPWVQAVMLGLHERGLRHHMVLVPPLRVLFDSGVVMPVAQVGDAGWHLDSERVLVSLGFSELSAEERRALMACFKSGSYSRVDSRWEFWRRFSEERGGHPVLGRRMWNQFWRSFSTFYFFSLLCIARTRWPRPTTEQIVRELSFWQQRLKPGAAFLGGGAPDTADLQLFGVVQMLSSIPGPALEVLQQEPELERLRGWIGAMQTHFADYARLHSVRDFEPKRAELEVAPLLERCCYWCGATMMWIAFPLTLPVTLLFALRVRARHPTLTLLK